MASRTRKGAKPSKKDLEVTGPISVGRVVAGTDKQGQVLVELTGEGAPRPESPEGIEGTECGEGHVVCEIPRGRRAPDPLPVVGDFAKIEWTPGAGAAEAVVHEVLPRRTSLLRRNPMSRNKPQLLCANLDVAVLVISVEPNFSELMVDRVLVSAHAQGLEAAIVLNKCDLVPPGTIQREEVDERLEAYERIGYTVLRTSAETREGVAELRAFLSGKTSILIGNSGVGKSHLLNCLGEGEIAVRVGEISEKLRLGTHTTTTSTLHRLPGSGEDGENDAAFLIDSPGARRFAIWDVEGDELKEHYVEFLPLARRCRFRNCSHIHEPECAVKDAVQMHEIPVERYKRYGKIREALLAGWEGDFDPRQLTTEVQDAMLPG